MGKAISILLLLMIFSCGSVRAEENANEDPIKSWVRDGEPNRPVDKEFYGRLDWRSKTIGPYVLRLGYIYDKWVAALQFAKPDGTVVMTEITPPQEYITIVDAATGTRCAGARDVNHDKVLEIAFLHRKLYDPNYHMYTVYALTPGKPKLLWKSGGKLGDWLHETR
jgi:hypothetical protein